MSRQNKVNPGMYTQRGRLAQDDAARELRKQRVIGSEHTWQPVQRDQQPRPPATAEGADDAAADEPVDSPDEQPAPVAERSRAARVTANAKPAAKAKTAAKGQTKLKAKAKAPRLVRRSAKGEGGAARKAVLARGAGKGSALLPSGRKKTKAATTAKRKR